jgi:hypothetical protein
MRLSFEADWRVSPHARLSPHCQRAAVLSTLAARPYQAQKRDAHHGRDRSSANRRKPLREGRELAKGRGPRAMRRDGTTLRAIGAVTGHGPASVQRILERASR